MKVQDLHKGDKVRVRTYTKHGMGIVPGTITGFTSHEVIVRADPQYSHAGNNGVVRAWYSDVLVS